MNSDASTDSLTDSDSEASTYSVDPTAYNTAHGQLPSGSAKRLTVVAFDDFINFPAGNATFPSSSSLDHLLGLYDQLAIEVIVDQAPTSLSIGAQIYHSGDGQAYFKKAASAEVPGTAVSAMTTTLLPIGYDDGTYPSLGFVNVNILATGAHATNSAHVKMTITGNNTRERTFTAQVDQFVDKYFFENCHRWYLAGTRIRGMYEGRYKGGTSDFRFGVPPFFQVYWSAPGIVTRSSPGVTDSEDVTYYRARLKHPFRMCVGYGNMITIAHENKPLWQGRLHHGRVI